jgi:exodeoxyribonuclease VII large subunit
VASGKITAYAGQSRYQLTVESIQPAGLGAMMQILNERKTRLEKEGLFNQAHKKALPFLPKKIGVITSITGAVIKDIIHRIMHRHPTNVIIWPVLVQGDTAAEEISRAIKGFNALNSNQRPDLLIVARGGGSIEDLWPFNEENVVRSVYDSEIPIISAVGHETDYTLIDLVADVRAPTPTAAAEFAVPVNADLKYTLSLYNNKLLNRINSLIEYKYQVINNYNSLLKYQISYLNSFEQRLDEISFRLNESLPNLIKIKTALLIQFPVERFNPNKFISYKILQMSHQVKILGSTITKVLDDYHHKLNVSSILLTSLDYNNILKRGFTIIVDDNGKFLKSKNDIDTHDKFNIRFFDGEVMVKKL